jgi:hypothetical protein
MPIRAIPLIFLLFFSFSALAVCAGGPFVTMDGKGGSIALTTKEISQGKDAILEAAMPDPVTFSLKRGTPNGVAITAIYGDAGERLNSMLPPEMAGFDDRGELEEGFTLQLAVCDLNNDGKPEVLIATGDGAATLTAAIFTYTPKGDERFARTGMIEGQKTLHVDDKGAILVPFGSQGRFTEYVVAADGAVTEKP